MKNFEKGIDIPFFICYNVDTLKKGSKKNGKNFDIGLRNNK